MTVLVVQHSELKIYFTGFYKARKFEWLNAGHPPPTTPSPVKICR